MAAVIGRTPEVALKAIQDAGAEAANFNGAGQIVAGGTLSSLDRLAQDAPRGTRVVRLKVAGAFHTSHMAPAEAALREAFHGALVRQAKTPVVVNGDGSALSDGHAIVESVIRQVARPVRWDLVQLTMTSLAVTHHLELDPAGVLTTLAKKALPNLHLEKAVDIYNAAAT
jgi:[acyl-carrier-protein] S-malonyltransferase